LIATTILKLLRARPGEGSASPICLSFWHDTSTLDLSYLVGANPDYILPFGSPIFGLVAFLNSPIVFGPPITG
ncbi:MAG: hypothetical protein AAB833_00960, partial [Patescibacteria group bacterium]